MSQSDNSKISSGSSSAQSHPFIIAADGGFCVHLPEWNVSGEGTTVEEAYRNFEINRAAFEQRSQKYGLSSATASSYAIVRKPLFWQELSLFFMKTGVAAAAVIIVVVLLLPNLGAAVRHQVEALVPATLKDPLFWAVQLPTKINGRFDRMEPADREQMNREWNKLIDRSAPALRALKCAP